MNRLVIKDMMYQNLGWWKAPFCIYTYFHDDLSKMDISYDRNLLLQVL